MSSTVGRLLLLRTPVAFIEGLLMYWSLLGMYRSVTDMGSPLWGMILNALPPEMSPDDIQYFLRNAPALPPLAHVWPWVLLAAPVYVLSLWLHDAVWDHGCLWMLGGLKEKRGFRISLIADSEALQVGVFGAALGLLSGLPGIGWILSLPVGLVGIYFWILRGFALAAFHGCPTWKGVAATILHVVIAVCCLSAFVMLLFILFTQAVG